jgi:outer membrane receptor protein involved in Fe transport
VEGGLWTFFNFASAQVWGTDLGFDFTAVPGVMLSSGISYINNYAFKSSDPTAQQVPLNTPSFKARGSLTLLDLMVKKSFVKLAGRYQNAYPFWSGRWRSSLFYADGMVPQRFVADVAMGYTFDNGLKVSAVVSNLLDDHGVDVLGVAAQGRLAFVSLEYKFSTPAP